MLLKYIASALCIAAAGMAQAQTLEQRLRASAAMSADLTFPTEAQEWAPSSPLKMAIYKPSGHGPFAALVIHHEAWEPTALCQPPCQCPEASKMRFRHSATLNHCLLSILHGLDSLGSLGGAWWDYWRLALKSPKPCPTAHGLRQRCLSTLCVISRVPPSTPRRLNTSDRTPTNHC